MSEFVEFNKIPRLNRAVIVTEKIDGTNAQVFVKALEGAPETDPACIWQADGLAIFAGSRNRWITPEKDNFGFAAWVRDHAESLAQLGPGRHFGEWWGSGVQRGYGLTKGEKRFSLFNVGRWYDEHGTNGWIEPDPKAHVAPTCCYVVPVLAMLPNFDDVNTVVAGLRRDGSKAAPGFLNPDGVVAFHSASGTLYKVTCEKDEKPKGAAA